MYYFYSHTVQKPTERVRLQVYR